MSDDLDQIKELKKTIQDIEGIFKDLSKSMSDFSNMQKISNKISLTTLSLNKDLDKVQQDKIKQIEQELTSLDKVVASKVTINKVSQKANDLSEEQLEALKKQEQEQAQMLANTRIQNQLQMKAVANQSNLSKLIEDGRIAQVGINEVSAKTLNTKDRLFNIQQHTKDILVEQKKLSQDYSEQGIIQSQIYNGLVDISTSQLSNLNSQIDSLDKISLSEAKTVDVTRELDKLHQQEKVYLANKDKLTQSQQQKLEGILNTKKSELQEQETYNQKITKMQESLKGFSGQFDKSISSVSGSISKIPGGDFLKKHLKFDEVSSGIKDKVMGSMTEAFAKGGTGAKGMFSALTGGVKSFGMALITGPQAIIFGILALVGGLVKLFMDLDKDVEEYSQKMEVSRVEATKMQETIGDMARDIGQVGVNTAEVAKTMFELRDQMGGLRLDPSVNKDQKRLVETTTLLNEKYGTTTEEAMNLNGLAKNLGTSQEELASTMAVFGKNTIGANKAMKALAKVPKSIAGNFKGTTAELAKAVIKAESLGMTLEQIDKIGDSTLDIESSLQAEMEARVMTGKNLNLDKIRELSLAGDIAGMQDEIVKQAGTLDKFNQMDKLGKEAIAKAMGMNVDQMTEMLTKAKENEELGWSAKELDEYNKKSAEELNQMLDEKGNKLAANQVAKLKEIAQQKESAGLQARFSDALTKVKETMFKLVTPIMEIVNGLFASGDATEKTSNALGGVGEVLGVIGSLLGVIFKSLMFIFKVAWTIVSGALSPMFAALGQIKTALQPIFDIFSSIFSTTEEGGKSTMGFMDMFMKSISVITGLLTYGLVIPFKLVAGYINILVKIFTGDFSGALKDVGNLIADVVFTPFEKVGELIDNIFGTNIMGFITSIKDAFLGLFDNTLGDNGFGGIGKFVTKLWDGFKQLGKIILDYILAPFNFLYSIGKGIYQMFTGDFMGGLETIGGGIKDFLLAPFNLIKGVVDMIFGKIDGMLGLAKKAGTFIKSLFGGGDDEEKKKPEGPKPVVTAAATGGNVNKGGVAVVGEKGPELVKLPGSAEVVPNEAINNSGGMGANTDKIVELLTQIYSEVQKPALIKLGSKFVGELDSTMGIRRNLRTHFDNQYGSTT